jgi:hypothetical protein
MPKSLAGCKVAASIASITLHPKFLTQSLIVITDPASWSIT